MTLTILLKYSSGGEAVFVGLLQGLLIAGVFGLYYWIKGKKKKAKEEEITPYSNKTHVAIDMEAEKEEELKRLQVIANQKEYAQDTDSIISQKLIQLVKELSDLTSELETGKNEKMITCESNMLFFILVWLVLAEETTDNSEIHSLFVQNLPDFEDYIKTEYEGLFRSNGIDADKYFSNRIDLFRDELRKYTQNSTYAFPKVTAAFYQTPLELNLKDYFGMGNLFISNCIPVWKDAVRQPVKILLAYKNQKE